MKEAWIEKLIKTHELVPPSVIIINKLNTMCNNLPSNDVIVARISYYIKKRAVSNSCIRNNLKTITI